MKEKRSASRIEKLVDVDVQHVLFSFSLAFLFFSSFYNNGIGYIVILVRGLCCAAPSWVAVFDPNLPFLFVSSSM